MANIIIGLVIAMFLIVAVYVGYHASQEFAEGGAVGHGMIIDLKLAETSPELLHIIEKQDGYKSII
jgi:hypothetical protein